MWPYFLFFFVPALLSLNTGRRAPSQLSGLHSIRLDLPWLSIVLFYTLVIGYRVEVGGDWGSYLGYVSRVRFVSFTDLFEFKDLGYQVINWLSVKLGWGIWGVNLTCGLIFSVGLAIFCRSLPRPWLAMTVAVPYLLIVVAMGYSRQGAALGLAMIALVSLGRKNTLWFVVWVLLGATCHKSAVLLLPIAALAGTRNRYWTTVWVGVVGIVAYFLLLKDSVADLYTNYLEAQYQSQGTLIRLLMNAVPAVILLLWQKRFAFAEGEASLWRWFAIMSLAFVVLFQVTPSTTAVDRVALYFLPLQLVVFSRFPDLFGKKNARILVPVVVAYYFLVHCVWLNFAAHAYAWVPYRNYLFE